MGPGVLRVRDGAILQGRQLALVGMTMRVIVGIERGCHG
jgi:hypothetical protein